MAANLASCRMALIAHWVDHVDITSGSQSEEAFTDQRALTIIRLLMSVCSRGHEAREKGSKSSKQKWKDKQKKAL